jgi:phenylalanyl-tRNA synthetase beta chain
MKASIQWLREFVEFPQTPAEIAEVLTMSGLEVEDILEDGDDAVLEISVTPNRPDCLSIRGIAREISAVLKLHPKGDPDASIEGEGDGPVIDVQDHDLCRRYTSRVIRGITTGQSPDWMVQRLERHGMRSVNNIVDITNYVLLETGHPLHAFDLNRLEGNRIVVKTAGSAGKIRTLDGEDRALQKEMLLIWDSQKPVAIAGVMGGLNSEVTESTVDILLESAFFDPRSVRRTAKALNLNTESSYRFERGADIHGAGRALDRAAKLIVETAGGRVTNLTDAYPRPFSPVQINVALRKIRDILGAEVSSGEVQEMFSALKIDSTMDNDTVVVAPPSFRQDIQRDTDVIEEIARLYGYDKIPTTLPSVTIHPAAENTVWKLVRDVKESMRKSGFSEAINYSFMDIRDLDKLMIPEGDRRRSYMKIRNPLKKEEEALRTTIIPALMGNVSLNLNRGEKNLALFEVSRIFLASGNQLPDEKLEIAAVQTGDTRPGMWRSDHDRFYDVKGALENLLNELGISRYAFRQDRSEIQPYYHPGKSCAVLVDGQCAGYLGTLHPEAARSFELTSEAVLFELDMERLFTMAQAETTYTQLPRYPYAERDLAIVVLDNVTVAEVEHVIRNANSDLIESVRLFDIYTGKPVPKGEKSLAFGIRFRAGDRTLTDSEVNHVHEEIVTRLQKELKAKLRS